MKIIVKEFNQLEITDLYHLLRLRSEVFVVEQNCVYQDIDNKDQKALHILGYFNGDLIGYTRCFPPGIYFKEAAIGRVLVKKENRKEEYGHQILSASIKAIMDNFKTKNIKLSAQVYLTKFYESHGFEQIGEPYLEDGIPHIAMIRV